VHRKSDVQSDDAVLNLFDVMPLADFENGIYNVPQTTRSQMVKLWVEKYQALIPNVTYVANEEVDLDTKAGQKRFKAINQKAIDGGYEGIMIKEPLAPYECKRSVAWLKLKPFIEVSLEVVDVEEGTGKNIGRLGAIVCSGTDDGKEIQVNVGSGFSDSDRVSFWNSRDALPGQIVEVRADAITQNQDGTYSLRFPRFKGFRGFKVGEKI
jgi:DNA ligase-1